MSIGVIKQTNTEIVAVLKSDSEVMARIQDRFHTMVQSRVKEGQSIEISCFFEELPLPGVGQVSLMSRPHGARLVDWVAGRATVFGDSARVHSDRDPRKPQRYDRVRQRERPGV